MIQVKREKAIGPADLKRIVSEIDAEHPPYGYILAAAANFSKKSYDVFRAELREKRVLEFYLWSKAELEDMLHLPKNDRILFTFFGISLVTRRQARATETRSIVRTKNKLFSILGGVERVNGSVLLRDLNDAHYPYEDEYRDFKKSPRWKEFPIFAFHPQGIWLHNHEYFGYLNRETNEWDCYEGVDLVNRRQRDEDEETEHFEAQRRAQNFWEFLPRRHQAYVLVICLLAYKDILVIDDKGDGRYTVPHLYAEFEARNGPFQEWRHLFKVGDEQFADDAKYKRVKMFPAVPSPVTYGRIHDKPITLAQSTLEQLKKYARADVLFDVDGRYDSLKVGDVVPVVGDDTYLQITHRLKATIKSYLDVSRDPYRLRAEIAHQLGGALGDEEEINILECKNVYKSQFERLDQNA